MYKATISSGIQSSLKIVFSLISMKIISYYLGPAGMAIYAQLQSIGQIAISISSSFTTSGVVKMISENKNNKKDVILNSILLLILSSLMFLFLLFLIAEKISYVFFSGAFIDLLYFMPVAAFSVGFIGLMTSIFNASGNYKLYSFLTILNAFFVAFFIVVLTFFFNKSGAYYSIVLSPLIASLIIFFLFKKEVFNKFEFKLVIERKIFFELMGFGGMAIFSAISFYGTHIFIREMITRKYSMDISGVWFAATRLSEVYMGILAVIFSTVLIPFYAENKKIKMRNVANIFFKKYLILSFLLSVSIYSFSQYIIFFLYGNEFKDSIYILRVYVLGDILKLGTWFFLYYFISRGKKYSYIFVEAFSYLSLIVCTYLFGLNDLHSLPLGYVVQNFLSLGLLLILFMINGDF